MTTPSPRRKPGSRVAEWTDEPGADASTIGRRRTRFIVPNNDGSWPSNYAIVQETFRPEAGPLPFDQNPAATPIEVDAAGSATWTPDDHVADTVETLSVRHALAESSNNAAVRVGLIGYGATAVYPYLAYDVLDRMIGQNVLLMGAMEAHKNYRKGINKGLMKITSKMGISTISSYRGAQLFEIVGLHEEVVSKCFKGTVSRIQGAKFADLLEDQQQLGKTAWEPRLPLKQGGLLKYVHDGEYHCFNPDVVATLQAAVRSGDFGRYLDYSKLVNERPVSTLRVRAVGPLRPR